MVPIAAALGEDASSFSLSRFTVHRVRKKDRSEFVDVVAKNYVPKYPITICYDSKILPDIMGIYFGPSSSPEIPLFKRFKKVWHGIERNNFQILEVTPELVSFKESAIGSLSNLLNERAKVPRDNYQELIELTYTVLEKRPEKIHWRAPGPVHHARWMAKLIYGIKIYLFHNEKDVVNLTKREGALLEKFVQFGAFIYTKAWIAAPLATEAPFIELKLWKDLKEYELFGFEISNAAILERHLWCLSDELVGLVLFSDLVLSPEKDAMVKMMKSKPDLRKVRGNWNILKTNQEVNLSDFVTERLDKLFQKLNIDDAFLNLPTEEWKQKSSYLQGRGNVRKLRVVNDGMEWKFHLMSQKPVSSMLHQTKVRIFLRKFLFYVKKMLQFLKSYVKG
ncbi:hypothetical protein AVEN_118182-1 [Araneus ventricosus]|uniref:Uncharacterized protein n=1 Tax=Araneus ventricosus TaxID=182803 RepID=A0A4Y2SIQ9_ARAVE|nr:hypothetical protein AVEN_118182-1 [Araneus ventricosus]